MANKATLRKDFLTKRRSLSADQVAEASIQICAQFQGFFLQNPTTNVHIFLPIKRQNEIDTWPIIEFLRSKNVDILISKSDFKSNSLNHFLFGDSTEIKENDWGIPEPTNALSIEIDNIEMVLVPLLVFDQSGFRIGYGKGFYDKFLSQCSSKLVKVGLSIFQPVPTIAHEYFDVKLDHCIVPEQILTFDRN